MNCSSRALGFHLLFLCFSIAPALADWPELGGSSTRNNVSRVTGLPSTWKPGKFDRRTGGWNSTTAENIKWVAPLGSATWASPVVAGGKILIGTNNSWDGPRKRRSSDDDLGCLLCLRESDGQLLWQYSAEKLPTGRVHDWPLQGICSTPLIAGDRAWFVNNRGEVVCLDLQGFADGEDDGPITNDELVLFHRRDWGSPDPDTISPLAAELDKGRLPDELKKDLLRKGEAIPDLVEVKVERVGTAWSLAVGAAPAKYSLTREQNHLFVRRPVTIADRGDADVVWRLDMLKTFGAHPHERSTCSLAIWKDTLFVCTGNGIAQDHLTIPAPEAASFVALDKSTGKVLWTSNLPGHNLHHTQWSSPAVGLLGGVPQVVFGGGDGWVYSFHAEKWDNAQPKLLWKFDTNPKDSILELGGRGSRNEPMSPPVLFDDKVYVTVGQDWEHGEGDGTVWCIDPTKKLDGGDVSPQLVLDDKGQIVPHRRVTQAGGRFVDNPASAVVWKFDRFDRNGNGKIEHQEQMHRSVSSVVIHENLLFAADFSGLVHCLDRRTGRPHWSCDLLSASYGTPLIADGRLFVADEDGDIAILNLSADPKQAGIETQSDSDGSFAAPVLDINMTNSIYTNPVAANGVLYIANRHQLFAIAKPATR